MHERFHRQLRDLVAEEFPTLLAAADAAPPGRLNRPLLAALGNRLLPQMFPTSVGGVHDAAVSATALCVLREELGRLIPAAETSLALQGLGAYPILFQARPEIVAEWLPQVVSGRAAAAFALTEAGAGSDAAAISTTAVRDGSGWRIHGEKMWISNAPDADIYTVFARTGTEPGARGVSAFAVPGAADGVGGEPLDMVAPHVIGRLELDGVHVGGDHLLAQAGRGFRVAMQTLDLFRPSVGAFAVGMAQHALDLTIEHTSRRHAFGGPLSAMQSVQHKVAEMALDVEAARLLVYHAAACCDDRAEGLTQKSAMAKLYATEAAQRVIDSAVQLHGARALQHGHPLEHLYREVRSPRVYEGASEVQKSIIARAVYAGAGLDTPR
ncbi:MAG: acyl-CoA dehydrogenase [Acidimicrobiaceae bacterium]|nr:acyl-CoA dehydrogenase [Acidimicrobiaceae bacterium]MXZ99900.1 acyl-CoA dehydrogenase [Acidimicrobiaceae bacterium]MYE75081.1 acyl-CoA dehydrogenase [Acidimicrobiaceae bacterium]MYE98572.1 acyl-CoA dehydrogenase [Acidimicrobiaceae bacterium]MYH43492.1 acyl-CoA dehydrogenase [Acidimicrobiaceae bacterium]